MIDLRLGNCLEILPTLDAGSVDAVITDPPYGLGFMGKRWDASLPSLRVWGECYRVMKPGCYLMAFGGTRTFHRLICSIEDAGFEIRDCLMWLYGSGFPKGKGCLKPAWEPITLARKPGGKVKPLGIEECRIEATGESLGGGGSTVGINPETKNEGYRRPWMSDVKTREESRQRSEAAQSHAETAGRWPPNALLSHHPECNGVCHPECVVRVLGEQSGTARSPSSYIQQTKSVGYNFVCSVQGQQSSHHGDTGTAARFFPQFRYEAKASREERNAGCEGMEKKDADLYGDDQWGLTKRFNGDGKLTNGTGRVSPQSNTHPCVKPLAVMEWLVKLACPDGGLVLDPFAGSGTTGMACERLGHSFLGIEIDPGYFAIAQKRIAAEQAKMSLFAGIEA